MTLGISTKRPDDVRDFDVHFSRWMPDGDSIQSGTAEVDGLTVESIVLSTDSIKVWLSGGEVDKSYDVTVTATTAGGRIKQTCFRIRVRNRC